MVCYDEKVYADLRTLFERELKRVEPYKSRRPLTKSFKKRIDYKDSLIRTYNNIVIFLSDALKSATLEERLQIQTTVVEHLTKLKEAFLILKLTYEFPKVIYDPIVIDNVDKEWTDLSDDDDNDDDDKSTDSASRDKILNTKTTNATVQTATLQIQQTSSTVQATNSNSNNQNNKAKMAQSPEDFMALAHRTINYKYNGDPLALDSFIDAINLLTLLCKPENKTICLQFIMTKLEGDAREAIETEPKETKDITDALKERIKPESSKVIEGRILALRSDKTNLTTFSQRAEELAEQYRRSLCNEGYSKAKAKELAIERTVDLCRRSARNDRVKTIIGAATFTEPKEVVARMITEINNVKLDKSMSQKPNNFHNKNSNNKNKSNNGNNYNGRQYNSHNSGSSNSQGNGNNRQNSGNSNGYRGNRNNYNNSNNSNGRTFYNSNNSSNSKRQNEQSLRYYSGNETNPSSGGTSDMNQ